MMSPDEVIVTLLSVVIGLGGWALWLFRASAFDDLRPGRGPVASLAWTIVVLTLLIVAILRVCAADDVREAEQYLFMYSVLGLAWLRLANVLFPFAGLHPHDDLIERGNTAALWAWIGAMTGVALCYAGGNIGNGPGWWVVVFSAGLAPAALGGVWLLMGAGGGVTDAGVIDRAPATGARRGGLLASIGLIAGAAVTGDWISTPATVADFVIRAWSVVPLVLLAIAIERALRPRPDRPRPAMASAGVLPATVYVTIAIAVTRWLQVATW